MKNVRIRELIVSVTSSLLSWFIHSFMITLLWAASFGELYDLSFRQALFGLMMVDIAAAYVIRMSKKA